jgi:hypothetical protein
MTRNISYYANLCEDRMAEYTRKHQADYKIDELQKLIGTLKRAEKESLTNISENYYDLLEEIFKSLPVHERYYAVVEPEMLEKYFSKLQDLKNNVMKDYGFNYHNHLRQYIKKALDIIFPFSPLSFLFLKDYSLFGFTVKETQTTIYFAVIIAMTVLYFWRKYQWKKSQI